MLSIWHLLFVAALLPAAVSSSMTPPAPVGGRSSREKRPVDVAHWPPNMPRGEEDPERGGVRDTNADDVAG